MISATAKYAPDGKKSGKSAKGAKGVKGGKKEKEISETMAIRGRKEKRTRSQAEIETTSLEGKTPLSPSV